MNCRQVKLLRISVVRVHTSVQYSSELQATKIARIKYCRVPVVSSEKKVREGKG